MRGEDEPMALGDWVGDPMPAWGQQIDLKRTLERQPTWTMSTNATPATCYRLAEVSR